MGVDNPKYESHFYGSVQGVVIGDNNTVTLIYQSGEQHIVPYLAPPLPPYELIGRHEQLHKLKQRLFSGDNLALSALNGLPGVGKTTLATALAHDRDIMIHFVDGVLWAGLGRKPDIPTLLGTWAIALGIPSDEVAQLTSIENRAKAIHAAISMKRLLLVIDDAWQVEAALAFKLGGPNCAHIVTTRLPEVALRFAGEGVTIVHELDEADGLMLLSRLAPKVVEAEPDEAQALVRSVGGLPLALALMGNYLRMQTYTGQPRRLRTALDRLQQIKERLRLEQPQALLERHPSLSASTPLSLLASIRISEQALGKKARSALWTLSVFPAKPNSFSEVAALAVSNMPPEVLDSLTDYGLLESAGPSRYTLHQTISDYASTKLVGTGPAVRMVEFFVQHAESHVMELSTLDPEVTNTLTALQLAFDLGMRSALVRGVQAFNRFLEFRGLYTEAKLHLSRAREAAKELKDAVGEAAILHHLGKIGEKRGDLEQAEGYYLEGLSLARRIGNREQISDLLKGLGWVTGMRAYYAQAEGYFQEGLNLARELKDNERICALLQGLAWVAQMQGDQEQAEAYFQEGLGLARKIGNREQITDLLQGLAWMTGMKGDFEQAEVYFQEGLSLARELGHRERLINPLLGLGWVMGMRGNYGQAEAYFEEGLTIAREIEHHEQMTFLANLGWVTRERGDYQQAIVYFEEGLALARKVGHREKISLMLTNLGEVESKRGDFKRAETHLQESLALAREIGHYERIIDPLDTLSTVAREQGDYQQAMKYIEEGLSLSRELGHRLNVSVFLNEKGELRLKQGDIASASMAFHEALALAREVGSKEMTALALYGLARVEVNEGASIKARDYGQESQALLESIGNTRATEVKQFLEELTPGQSPR